MTKETKVQSIINYLDEIQEIIHNKHHDTAIKYNLTVEEFHIMLHLNMKNTPPTVSELAQSFNNAQNTMSEKLTRLEEKSFIERKRDPKDKRISRIILSEQGKSIVASICYESENKFISDRISKIDDKQLNTLIDGLENLIIQLKEN
ncbi:MarR family transcriptional regulator [Clostridium sp. 19966]|uniref:MarR family winged helix-turn-helix transcriptional regulator n=1 Tax=Clostridium sp. 19966 TaxID=2768166 RepID=UPI0028DF7D34|nr:MarR family transcriptional regulator [Clostridium sp. 19966]MDT8717489.1 MarR family transcriptional regulator [Clostridium sp. 19966]